MNKNELQNVVALWVTIFILVVGALLVIRYADRIVAILAGGL